MSKQWKTIERKDFDYSASKLVVLSKVDNGSGEVIDIRNYYEDDNKQWLPTKKGVSIPIKDDLHPAKNVLLEALKMAGVTREQILDYFDFEDTVGSQD